MGTTVSGDRWGRAGLTAQGLYEDGAGLTAQGLYEDGGHWEKQMMETFLEPYHLFSCQMLASLHDLFLTILLLPISYHKNTMPFAIEVRKLLLSQLHAMLSFSVCISNSLTFVTHGADHFTSSL